jgi:CxxC-x17-CxxC domain-containing protein
VINVVKDKKPTDDPKTTKAAPADDKAAPADDKAAPVSDAPASPADTATPAGTDQQGRQLYNVKCSKCSKDTQVPFKPSGDRPVYCRDCYMEQRRGNY